MWALLALLVLATACEKMTMPSAPTPTQPISTPDPTFSSTRGEAPAFPAVSRPARIYVADDRLTTLCTGHRWHRAMCSTMTAHSRSSGTQRPCTRRTFLMVFLSEHDEDEDETAGVRM